MSFLEPGPKTDGPVGNAKNLPSEERANAPASLALLADGLVSSNPTGIASTGGVLSGTRLSLAVLLERLQSRLHAQQHAAQKESAAVPGLRRLRRLTTRTRQGLWVWDVVRKEGAT